MLRALSRCGVVLAWLAVGCEPTVEQSQGLSDQDVAAIKGALDAYVETQLSGDVNRGETFFTEDLPYIPPGSPPIHGLAQIREAVEGLDQHMETLELVPKDIRGSGNLAYVHIEFRERFTLGQSGVPVEQSGNALRIFRKQSDGRWLTSVLIYNLNRP